MKQSHKLVLNLISATIRQKPGGQNMAETIHVNIANSPYDVTVRPGLLADAGAVVRALTKSAKIGLVTDTNALSRHGNALADSLKKSGFDPIIATIPVGEDHKNLSTLLPVYDKLLSAAMERSTPIIALGGGVVGDMTGFLAATILRGVPFIQMPTTLLAM